MSKFVIECPNCHTYNQANDGFFARKKIHCSCGNVINVRTDKMTVRKCAYCGNNVMYDQSLGEGAVCPVCHKNILEKEELIALAHIACPGCGCDIQVEKDDVSETCPVCDKIINVQALLALHKARTSETPAVLKCENTEVIIWKHPLTDFPIGSQLIVHESQEAVFVRNGEALKSFTAGRYTLDTGVLPAVSSLGKLPVSGQPFHAEVYYVNLITLMNIKWGTPNKVGLFDPVSGIHVELGACGSFNVRVMDARRLLMRLVGAGDGLTLQQLFNGDTGFFRSLIVNKVKALLARTIKENRINVLELDEHIDQISEKLALAINAELEEYGLYLPEFYVDNILAPDDDPNFKRMKQQHAEQYLRIRDEQIRKAEAEAAFERKAVEAQTDARMKVIHAQGEADTVRIKAQADADAYRMQAEAEAQEMHMKGYTYQQETARQVGLEAMKHEGGISAGAFGGMMGDVMQMGVGLGAIGGVMGIAKEAVTSVGSVVSEVAKPQTGGWNCKCGENNITGNFCPNCGTKRVVAWNCTCGQTGNTGNFCMNCGAKRAETWDCSCGEKDIKGNFCPNCGNKRS